MKFNFLFTVKKKKKKKGSYEIQCSEKNKPENVLLLQNESGNKWDLFFKAAVSKTLKLDYFLQPADSSHSSSPGFWPSTACPATTRRLGWGAAEEHCEASSPSSVENKYCSYVCLPVCCQTQLPVPPRVPSFWTTARLLSTLIRDL